jgi:hypothetical protein
MFVRAFRQDTNATNSNCVIFQGSHFQPLPSIGRTAKVLQTSFAGLISNLKQLNVATNISSSTALLAFLLFSNSILFNSRRSNQKTTISCNTAFVSDVSIAVLASSASVPQYRRSFKRTEIDQNHKLTHLWNDSFVGQQDII